MLTKDSLHAIVLDNGERLLNPLPCWERSVGGHADSKLFCFIFSILIKNSQNTAYIKKTLYIEWIFEQIAKTAKTVLFSV